MNVAQQLKMLFARALRWLSSGKFTIEYSVTKRNLLLIKEAEVAANSNYLRTVYCVTKELAYISKSLDGTVRDGNDRLPIHGDEQLKWWKGDSTTVLNHITFGSCGPNQ